MNAQVPLITAEQFIWALADERNFDILAGPLRNKIHRNNGRSCDWFLQAFYDTCERLFEFASVELHRDVTSSQGSRRLRCIE